MKVDELIYSMVFLLLGIISLLWYRKRKIDKKDPFLIKPTFLIVGVLCLIFFIVLLVKTFA